ncbi:amino acid permease 3-like [Telopea speciosissima]|uniref:amino acid permease 3-like n=1 Tax=Telopea speciosissima TaxID=54955 RepID=UPI001CC7A5AD|nr:amino acid permease 3-like [Telopea speciosissima]
MEETRDPRKYLQIEIQPKSKSILSSSSTETEPINSQPGYSKCFDDDGRLKRSGTVWTATSHIITAVIGSGVLSLAWAVAQLGWVAGPIAMLLFTLVTFYTSNLLSRCYRSGDPTTGTRNYTYMDAVKSNLGGRKVMVCGTIQYLNLFGVAIGYTIAASISIMAIKKSSCIHKSRGKDPCKMSNNWYMITVGLIEVILSQIPDFDQLWWLSIVAAIMSFTYSAIGLGLGITKTAENGSFKGSLMGVSIGEASTGGVTSMQKMWRSVQALGAIAFAYSYSVILIEIQDTVKSPPAEYKTMRKATSIGITVTTVFYMLCGCMGYAAFGDKAPGNLLTGFGYFSAYWVLDIANIAIVVHLIGAYQVYCQPLFAFVEKWSENKWPNSNFIGKEYEIPIPFYGSYELNLFRLIWRTVFVMATTVIAMLLPFFNDVVGILGALGFWPLTVYFPVEIFIAEKKIGRWTSRWLGLQILSLGCLFITIVAAVGSVAGVLIDLKTYKPFQSN